MSNQPKYPFYGVLGRVISANTVRRTSGGAKAVGKVVFTGNLVAGDVFSVNGVDFTCMASGASGELQFNVDTTLSLSLDALITKLNACTDGRVSRFTYTKTDTNSAVTATGDNYAASDNDVALSSTHDSVVVTAFTGGQDRPDVAQDPGLCTTFNLPGSTTEEAYLTDGFEGQMKVIAMVGSGTVNVKGDHLPGSTANYALNGNDCLVLVFAGAKWRLVLNDGAVAT